MISNIDVSFPGGKRVDASVGDFVVHTDQPQELGGEGSAVAPFDLFLASLATCAGIYVLGFCQARNLSTEGLAMQLAVAETDPATRLPARIRIELKLPEAFPGHLRAAVQRAAESCKIKKVIAAQPVIEVVSSNAPASFAHAS
jgi:ribosomal protein S12 methylthiotransferase accessory factor